MLYWLDYEGAPNAAEALVNDLNMQLVDPISQPFNPWILDPTPNPVTLDLPATRGVDTINNMEQVTIIDPPAGIYTAEVHGFMVPQGPQKYYILYEFMTDVIDVTYPIGGEAFAPGETQTLRWDAYGTPGDFAIEYSIDSGANWVLITSAVSDTQRYYEWVIPNVLTGHALIKVSRGILSASSEAVFTIMEVPQNLNIDWACPDSCQMSWDSVPGAVAYEVSWLGNMYMDSIGISTDTSLIIGGINPVDEFWFSVKALGPNNAVGRRAYAIRKNPGVFNCIIPVDAELAKLSPASSTIQDCQDYTNVNIEVRIKNMGTSDLTNIDVYYQLDSYGVVSEIFNGTITPGDSANHSFITTIDLSSPGSYKLNAWLSYLNDGNRYNDTIVSIINTMAGITISTDTTENMESFTLCSTASDCENTICTLDHGWINVMNLQGDDIDWRTNSGSTPSNNTGPSFDHTYGTYQGKYLYLESSSCYFKEALLISPCIDLTYSILPVLEFWYHMYGSNTGVLHVDALTGLTWNLDIMTPLSGNYGNAWNKQTIDLSAYNGQIINIRFRGITGSSYRSDMALDDININNIGGIGISEDFLNSNIQLYPNPGNGVFNMSFKDLNEDHIDITVSDLQGRILFHENIQNISGTYKTIMDLSAFSPGIYFVNFKNERFTHSKMIIVQ